MVLTSSFLYTLYVRSGSWLLPSSAPPFLTSLPIIDPCGSLPIKRPHDSDNKLCHVSSTLVSASPTTPCHHLGCLHPGTQEGKAKAPNPAAFTSQGWHMAPATGSSGTLAGPLSLSHSAPGRTRSWSPCDGTSACEKNNSHVSPEIPEGQKDWG